MELRMANEVSNVDNATATNEEPIKDTRQYWQKTWDNLCPGVIFKINQISAVDRLTIVYNKQTAIRSGHTAQSTTDLLKYWLWSKNGGGNWAPVLNESGTSRLPELDTEPSLIFDLANLFQDEVILPVFIGSKTFHK